MPIDNLDTRLSSLDDAFGKASTEGAYPSLPEPGWYAAILRGVEFFEAKSNNAAYLKILFEVALDKDYAGTPIDLIYNLEPNIPTPGKPTPTQADIEQKLGFLKRDLMTLGVDVNADDFSMAWITPGSPLWNPLLDVPVRIEVKDSKRVNPETNLPYRNAYLKERAGDPLPMGGKHPDAHQTDVPALTEQPTATSDPDDIPF